MQTAINLSRRRFFGGKPNVAQALRPPWAAEELLFRDLCTRCDACLPACPNGIVRRGDGGFPEVDFSRGECSFCRACVDACRPGALRVVGASPPWRVRAVVGDECLTWADVVCRTCGDVCEAGAIHFRPQVMRAARPEVDLLSCTGCGACVAPCPQRAIRVSGPLPGVPA